jgi:hypothetical protein
MVTPMLTELGLFAVVVLLVGAVYQLQRRAERRAQRLALRGKTLAALDRRLQEASQ